MFRVDETLEDDVGIHLVDEIAFIARAVMM